MNKSQFTVRRATPADAPAIQSMSDAIQRTEIDLLGFPMQPVSAISDAYISEILERAATQEGEVLVCAREPLIVGYMIGYKSFDDDMLIVPEFRSHALIADIYVQPEARGLGAARMLMNEFAVKMKAKGCRFLRVCAKSKNQGAIEAYLRSGFEPYESTFFKPI